MRHANQGEVIYLSFKGYLLICQGNKCINQ
jgi:hypothetical protein